MEAIILVGVRDNRNRYLTDVCVLVQRRPLQQLPYRHMRNQPYENQQTRRFAEISAHHVRFTSILTRNILESNYLAC